jgi:hypothetical protein
MVAVFTLGIAAHSYQNAAAVVMSSPEAQKAQMDLEMLKYFPNSSNDTKAGIGEGQEGIKNATEMLNQLNGQKSSSLLESDPLGQGGILGQQ